MKNFAPSMRAILAGHSVRTGAAETAGAAAVALAGADDAVCLSPASFLRARRPAPTTTTAPRAAAIPRFDFANPGRLDGVLTAEPITGAFELRSRTSLPEHAA